MRAPKSTHAEILIERKKRVRKLIAALRTLFPGPNTGTVLQYRNHWELLVAVQLSAQCTDAMVNKVTERLFQKYRTLEEYVEADPAEFARDIKPTGYYNNKTKNILAAAKMVKEQCNGVLPRTIEEMVTIPGVARKTANVVLGNAYGIVEGIAVDTHVHRFAVRFDLTDNVTEPVKIERELMQIVPKKDWFDFTHLVILYGRVVAPARKYDIAKDPLIQIYPPAGKRFKKR